MDPIAAIQGVSQIIPGFRNTKCWLKREAVKGAYGSISFSLDAQSRDGAAEWHMWEGWIRSWCGSC
jgi:hypothetical protein